MKILNKAIAASVSNQKAYLEAKLKIAKKILEYAPEGDLILHRHRGKIRFDLKQTDRNGTATRSYLSPTAKDFNQYVRKYCAKIIELKFQKALLDLSTNPCTFNIDVVTETYVRFFEYFDDLTPEEFSPKEFFIRRWKNSGYAKNTYEFEPGRTYIADTGEKVRSKNEVICYNYLNNIQLPFRYDAEVRLKGGKTIFADFIIFHPRTCVEYYIEIFGCMSDADYVEKCVKRINDYAENGIYLGDRLLAFFESQNSPFNINAFKAIIEKVFL